MSVSILSHGVTRLLVERRIVIVEGLYAGITIDRTAGVPLFLCSSKGGMDVEEIARNHPAEAIRGKLDPQKGLQLYQSLDLARKISLRGKWLTEGARILSSLYEVFPESRL